MMVPRRGWARALLVAVAGTILLPAPRAHAEEGGRVTVLEENDSLYFNSDKHYTQGLRLSNLAPAVENGSAWNDPFDLLGGWAPVFPRGDIAPQRRYALIFGQSLFTPKNLVARPPDPNDRPYAGWLYLGASLLQESAGDRLENLELDLGTVGPMALGQQVQNDFHQLINAQHAEGWGDQIQNEPGLVLSYERLWRLKLIGDRSLGLDIVPQAGATIGNIFTYGEIGGLLRIGKGLDADYGPVRIRPALSGTDYFDASRLDGGGYYFYLGAQGRAVGRNVFVDGNDFRHSPSVTKKVLVGDLEAGISLYWSSRLRLGFSVVTRSEEFVGQRTPDEIGTAALAFSW